MKKIVLSAVVLVLGSVALRAAPAEKPKSALDSIKVYFQHLKQGLTESAVQGDYQRGRHTAVAAVRGAPQADARADADKPVMSQPAQTRRQKAEAAERREFEGAVDLVAEGIKLKSAAKVDAGIAALQAFEKAHPKSLRLGEVREAEGKAQQLKALLPSEAVLPTPSSSSGSGASGN